PPRLPQRFPGRRPFDRPTDRSARLLNLWGRQPSRRCTRLHPPIQAEPRTTRGMLGAWLEYPDRLDPEFRVVAGKSVGRNRPRPIERIRANRVVDDDVRLCRSRPREHPRHREIVIHVLSFAIEEPIARVSGI